ncbi:hypothetical protein [Telmatospirillum sp. J64-1]|uniref:hypothetical protein n=1 Tax=Telmatospirillum sp. J64-1 TaxID=2502183 RepID=UPI00115E1247|nr:hypothetical protein [Telmatospirillum sp. J64-1]
MKTFLVSVAFTLVLAVAGGFILPGFFSQNAADTYASPSARVGAEGTEEARDFSGRNLPE